MTNIIELLRKIARPLSTAPTLDNEVFLISFQEQEDGSTYVSANTGHWSAEHGHFLLGSRGSGFEIGDTVSTHWIACEDLEAKR